ncbi:MAG: hypothetical protein MUC58_14790 [Rhizobiaceae bacterium]|jgi:hypothetical protein|nr:hypothetical protein [Rhizobiaceae bacterium]
MMMLGKLPFIWLVLAISAVAIASYMMSLVIDGIFGKDGFGTIGNMVVFTVGFFGALIVAEMLGFRLRGLQMATFTGLGGAIGLFLTLALGKMVLDKVR